MAPPDVSKAAAILGATFAAGMLAPVENRVRSAFSDATSYVGRLGNDLGEWVVDKTSSAARRFTSSGTTTTTTRRGSGFTSRRSFGRYRNGYKGFTRRGYIRKRAKINRRRFVRRRRR